MAHAHHITPKALLIKVFGALVALTILTVATSRLDLGSFNVPLALIIASGKVFLVLSVFMALKWDNKVNALVIGISVLFVSVFLIFTLFDTAFRGDLSNVNPKTISDIERSTNGESVVSPPADGPTGH